MTALNPLHRVGNQIGEALKLHQPDMEHKTVYSESVELLRKVGIPAPETTNPGIPPSTFRRHAPAGDDCHRSCLQT